ncbi:MAG: glycosyltransferase [Thermodesulfobacteriota bacterium]
MNKISVIITSYNQKDYLKEAIESVLAQSFTPFEILVCDDTSADGSQEMIVDYEKRYPGLVKGVLHEKNLGISANRSSGIERAEGELVTWLDGDDRYRPKKLEAEFRAYQSDPEVKWVYSQVNMIDAKGKKLGVRYRKAPEGFILDKVVSMLGSAPRNQLVEKEALKTIGLFRDDMDMYEDFDLCLRLAKHYKCAYCPEATVEYRVHSGGVHNVPRERHLANLDKLQENFRRLVSGFDEDKRAALEEKLSASINRSRGKKEGETSSAISERVLNLIKKVSGR